MAQDTLDANEKSKANAEFQELVDKEMNKLLLQGVNKRSHISSPSEMYDHILDKEKPFICPFDRDSLKGTTTSRRLAHVSKTF